VNVTESGTPTVLRSGPGDKNVDPVIDQMALLLSQQKLVPFFGAGLSRAHLGLAAAELAHEMAQRVGVTSETLLSEVSDAFVDKFGEEEFVKYLKSKLVVPTLDDAKASAHRLLLSLGQNLLYTTNQDNIFELTAQKYGRPYRRIITLDDLSEAIPGERLLIKFHGDTDFPSSLVFGARSYRARVDAKDHPLDIKLRGDLLGKRLLFLGYSFSDENVAKLLDSVQHAFAGGMPPSYLIVFEYNDSMKALSEKYNLTVVDPRRLFPNAETAVSVFERCLKTLCDWTLGYQAKRGIETMFSGGKINPRMATDYEIDAVAHAIETEPFEAAVNAFRAEFDLAIVPESQWERVTNVFRKLTERATSTDDNHMNALRGALFNFRLPSVFAVQATAFVMAICNRRPALDGFDSLGSILCPAVPDGSQPSAAAMAVAILLERNEPISENFRRLATDWFDGWEDSPPQMRNTIQRMMQAAWQGSGSSFKPRPSFLPRKGFHQIVADLQANLPQRFKNPES
jgi:SIR2-like domain